jgi:hypothetical protein
MANLGFYARDLYPNRGLQDTRTMTQPEAYDKKVLEYDDDAAREKMEAETKSETPAKKIYMAVAVIALLAIGLGLMHD